MKYSKILKKTICILCVLATVFAFTACSKSKKISSSSSGSAIPSNVGKVTSEGYELPYEYSDGHVAVAKIVDDSKYKNPKKRLRIFTKNTSRLFSPLRQRRHPTHPSPTLTRREGSSFQTLTSGWPTVKQITSSALNRVKI